MSMASIVVLVRLLGTAACPFGHLTGRPKQATYPSEANQAGALASDLDVAAAAIPVRQHPALAALAVDLHRMLPRPVRVAVDQPAHAMAAQRLAHRSVVHVHDLGGLALDDLLALFPHLLDRRTALGHGLRQERGLEHGVASLAPPRLVLQVIGAQRVAVH